MLPLESYIRKVELKREAVPSFEPYPSCLPAVRPLTPVELHPNVTFFVGKNGMGKSTLLEAIAVAFGFNAEGGTINFNFSTKETHSNLYEYVRLVKGTKKPKYGFFLRAETFYPALTSSKSPTSRFRGIEET